MRRSKKELKSIAKKVSAIQKEDMKRIMGGHKHAPKKKRRWSGSFGCSHILPQ